jgi:hypothetical protein
MSVEIREVTIKANINTLPRHREVRQGGEGMGTEAREVLIEEVAQRVLELLERKRGR